MRFPLIAKLRRLRDLHRDERGAISIAAVFAMLLLAILLGMIVNAGKQIDGKVKMQNAADASAYSGGVVMARGMNSLAYTNHLLCDVFALTAYMREARDRQAESLVPDVLAGWTKIGPVFSASEFPKFRALGPAIVQKVPLEQELVTSFGEWAFASSELVLPVLEEILAEESIPKFQSALAHATPLMAQQATAEIARQHALTSPERGTMQGVLWRTTVDPVGGDQEEERRSLPVVDPMCSCEEDQADYQDMAREQRRRLSHRYLADWNRESLRVFDNEAKMSQFSNLWRGFTCGQLEKLLEDNEDRNLPYQIRTTVDQIDDVNRHLERDFMFVGVTYWEKVQEILPGLFANPQPADSQAFAQIMLFPPQPRLVKGWRRVDGGGNQPNDPTGSGGVPGDYIPLPDNGRGGPGDEGEWEWYVTRQRRPMHWNLLNQNWTVQLVPATTDALPEILQTAPGGASVTSQTGGNLRLPNLNGVTAAELREINTH